jgi:4-aminobutyrate aminotransferase-like enzyme
VVRLAPPLVIERTDLDQALDALEETLHEVARHREPAVA